MSDDQGGRDDGVASPSVVDSTARWQKIWSTREMLLSVARRRGAGPDAEDIAQEAMARAVDHPEVEDGGLQAWLVAVTTRLCIDAHRRRAYERARWQRASGEAGIMQSAQDVEEEACARSEAAWVAHLVTDLLPPRQVRALELTAAGFDVQQVATTLGVRYRAAESLLARARKTIRAAISASLGAVAWIWRSHLPANSGTTSISVALASAAATAVIAFIPPMVSSTAPGEAAAPASSAPGRPPVLRADSTPGGPPAGLNPADPDAPRSGAALAGPASLPGAAIAAHKPQVPPGLARSQAARSHASGPPDRPAPARGRHAAKSAPDLPLVRQHPPVPPAEGASTGSRGPTGPATDPARPSANPEPPLRPGR
jgi:RNA polymerase sigma factor (sigma-70 family)